MTSSVNDLDDTAVYMAPALFLRLFAFSAHRACIILAWVSQKTCANSMQIFEII